MVGCEPRVDATRVEGVAAGGEESELVVRLELREADSAVGGGGFDGGDGVEGEEREGVDEALLIRGTRGGEPLVAGGFGMGRAEKERNGGGEGGRCGGGESGWKRR